MQAISFGPESEKCEKRGEAHFLLVEDTSIVLGDEAAKIILHTKGHTRELEQAVIDVRSDEKWRIDYMVLNEILRERERIGRYTDRVAHARKFRTRYNAEELAEICFVSSDVLNTIFDLMDAHPDWDDEKIAESVDFE